jgi:uncharacterized protein (DUF58 family)
VSPTPRSALLLGALALSALVLPLGIVALAALAVAAATIVDALSVRAEPTVTRSLPRVLSRAVPVAVEVQTAAAKAGKVRVRQPTPEGLALEPSGGGRELRAELVARRRGRVELPAPGVRLAGRLGLGAWYHRPGPGAEVHVYPDLVTARRLALAAREGRTTGSSRRVRGPLGLGTDFESVREWQLDDDVRHVNWRATQRTGRPMTNQYRLEQAREIVFMIDAGRLMAAPLGPGRTRLDATLDALAAVALAADELSDHCGAIAFDAEVRGQLRPRRNGGTAIIRAFFDLQPRPLDSDYLRAFGLVAGGKRALVMVLTDLFDESAARALIEAVPVLSRRHAVVVASASDPDIEGFLRTPPDTATDVYAAAAALDLVDARARAAALIARAGAQVVEAPAERLAAACVHAYLAAKARLRL